MGKRYYCDFCERSFRDTLAARKSHNACAQHVEKRRRHYFELKSARERLAQVRERERCLDFYKHGLCHRGEEKCKFVHISKDDYKKLMDEAKKEKWDEERREKEEKKKLEEKESEGTSGSSSFDLTDEQLDPYAILNAWYRKKGINIRTEFIDGKLVDSAT